MAKQKIKALALFSGGLDSILSCRVIMAQGIEVIAIRYVTPFFGYELLAREKDYLEETRKQYGVTVFLRDLSDKYFAMLRNPAHGYGKNFNPCVDCKILIAGETRAIMDEIGASFIISGEVIGQRPMSQRRDTLRIIEKESGCEDILLRPLCAKNMPETLPERTGQVDRNALYGFSGRSRIQQMELAESFEINNYPSPAGGCVLTEPILAPRIAAYYEQNNTVSGSDVRLLLIGRQFHLPAGGWLVIGRNEQENKKVLELCQPDDLVLQTVNWPGPSAILRNSGGRSDLETAAALLMRFSKKGGGRVNAFVTAGKGADTMTTQSEVEEIKATALSDEEFLVISGDSG